MTNTWISALLSTTIVSMISFVGIFLISIKVRFLHNILSLLISFAIGTLLGNTFFHLIPESYHSIHETSLVACLILSGFLLFLIIEQLLHTKKQTNSDVKIKPYGYLSLYADSIHNFTDGILIGASWMISPELGITTSVAIIVHEIPQEISDFGILIRSGFTKRKALWYNFASASTAILGTILTLWIGDSVEHISVYILPIAAGGFIYLAVASLLPEVLKEKERNKSWIYFIFILIGILTIYLITSEGSHIHSH